MDTPLKPLLSSDIDADLEDDSRDSSSSDPPPRYRDVLSAPQPEIEDAEDDDFVKWWKQIRSHPPWRDSILSLIRAWSDDRRRNAILVQKRMTGRAVVVGAYSALVRATSVSSAGTYADTHVLLLKMLGCSGYMLPLVIELFHRGHPFIFNAVIVTTLCCILFGVGAWFARPALISAHIALLIRSSLRAADAAADDARIYVPPVALLARGTRFTRRRPFYEPVPFVACEDLRELGVRIRELEVRLRAHEGSGTDPLGLLWQA
jgi:hypothetical protein